jgi:hypothetical protein
VGLNSLKSLSLTNVYPNNNKKNNNKVKSKPLELRSRVKIFKILKTHFFTRERSSKGLLFTLLLLFFFFLLLLFLLLLLLGLRIDVSQIKAF